MNNIQTQTDTGGAFTDVGNTAYSRDNAGNVTSSKDSVTGQAACFSYDHLAELTQAWTPNSTSNCTTTPSTSVLGGPAPFWENFSYDTTTGNRLTETLHATTSSGTATTDTYAYPAATSAHPHAVSTVTATGGTTGTSTYIYDSDGSTTSRPGDTITYDATGKPSTITTPMGTQQNIYDASGNLLLSVDPVTGATLYNGDTELHQAVGSTQASATRTYTGANNTPVAERDTVAGQSGNTLYWLFTDVDGTVTVQVNSTSGAVVRRYTDPFGNTEGNAPSGWADNHGYLNKVQDTSTGLLLLGARDYDSATGRFTSSDELLAPLNPIQNNGYSYAGNNPITNTDPDGKCYNAATDSLTHTTNCGGHNTGANVSITGDYTPELNIHDIGRDDSLNVLKRWITGNGPRTTNFSATDAFSLELERSHAIDVVESQIASDVARHHERIGQTYDTYYKEDASLLWRDIDTYRTVGADGNLPESILGSFDVTYSIVSKNSDGTATIVAVAHNATTNDSATRIPGSSAVRVESDPGVHLVAYEDMNAIHSITGAYSTEYENITMNLRVKLRK